MSKSLIIGNYLTGIRIMRTAGPARGGLRSALTRKPAFSSRCKAGYRLPALRVKSVRTLARRLADLQTVRLAVFQNAEQHQIEVPPYQLCVHAGQPQSRDRPFIFLANKRFQVTTQRVKSGMMTSPRNTLTRPCQTFNPYFWSVEM